MSHIFTVQTSDQMIFSQEMVAMLSVTIITVILHWTITSLRKDYTLTASATMRIPCILSISSFWAMNAVGMFGWNNVFISISSLSCKLIYPFCLFCYNIGKISMYWMFTFRIELIFFESKYALSSLHLRVYRCLSVLVPSALWIIWIFILGWDDIKPHRTQLPSKKNSYSYCFPQTFSDSDLAQMVVTLIAISDLVFSAVPLILFISKYIAIARANQDNLDSSLLMHQMSHISIIKKSTSLVVIAVASTWCITLGEAYIVRQIGFYLPLDAVINSICMACLFQFGDDFYQSTFAKLECLCFAWPCCPLLSIQAKDSACDPTQNAMTDRNDVLIQANGNDCVDNEQYHVKIHSHNNCNERNDSDINGRKFESNILNFGQSYSKWKNTPTLTRLNIQTPDQRYQPTPDMLLQLNLSATMQNTKSITEFIPLNMQNTGTNQIANENGNENINENTNQMDEDGLSQFDLPSCKHDNAHDVVPANKTGAIVIIQKKKGLL